MNASYEIDFYSQSNCMSCSNENSRTDGEYTALKDIYTWDRKIC